MERSAAAAVHPDAFDHVAALEDAVDQQYCHRRQGAHLQEKAQQQRHQPYHHAGAGGKLKGVVGRLADLGPFSLVAAFQPFFLEPTILDAASLLRVHTPGQVHHLLL